MTLLNWYRALPAFRGKYRVGYALFKNLMEKPQPVEVVVNKQLRYHLPNSTENIGKEIMLKGEYEIASVKAIIRELEKKDRPVFFDIGANIGSVAIPVKQALRDAEVHAFEASPATFRYLKMNFEANGLPADTLYNKLVYSVEGEALPFYDSAQHYGKSSLAPIYTREAITVNAITIDNYCRQRRIEKIDLVKVDVQGYEKDVFKGMRSLLKEKKVGAIFFEFEDWAEEAAGFQPGASQEFLLAQGYQLFSEKGKRLEAPARKGSLMLWARPANENRTVTAEETKQPASGGKT